MNDDFDKKDTGSNDIDDVFNQIFNQQISEEDLTPINIDTNLKPQPHPHDSNATFSANISHPSPSEMPQQSFVQPNVENLNTPSIHNTQQIPNSTYNNNGYNQQASPNPNFSQQGAGVPPTQPVQNNLPVPPNITYSSQSNFPPTLQPVPVKVKKKRGILPLVACMLVTALLGGVVGAGVVSLTNDDTVTPSATSNVSTVNYEYSPESVVGLIEQTEQSIVGIRCTGAAKLDIFNGGTTAPVVDEGSGVVYTEDGYIITNYHVVAPAVESNNANSKIEVFFQDNPEEAIPATFVDGIKDSDIAVIKIEKSGLQPIKIGSSANLKVGQPVIALGSPGGLDFLGSATTGIISGLNRTIATETSGEMTYIQTNAAINPGNSGGALIDGITGELIGINTAKLSSSGDTTFEGMGFAIPVDTVVEIADACINGTIEHKTYLGIQVIPMISADDLEEAGLPRGVVVYDVVLGGPCDDAGVRTGDIITKFNGIEVTSLEELQIEQAKYKPGDVVKLTIYRAGEELEVDVTLDQI